MRVCVRLSITFYETMMTDGRSKGCIIFYFQQIVANLLPALVLFLLATRLVRLVIVVFVGIRDHALQGDADFLKARFLLWDGG